MNDLQIFTNEEFGEVRTITEGDKTLFCATDIAKALGYDRNPQDAIRRHCKEDGCVNHAVIDSLGREQQAKFINEGNVYRLITHSKLPAAITFFSQLLNNIPSSLWDITELLTNLLDFF